MHTTAVKKLHRRLLVDFMWNDLFTKLDRYDQNYDTDNISDPILNRFLQITFTELQNSADMAEIFLHTS